MGEVEAPDFVSEAAVRLDAVVADCEDFRIQLLEAGVVRPKGG